MSTKKYVPKSIQPLLEEIVATNRVIEKMMVGLIPLRCRVVDYSIVGFSRDANWCIFDVPIN